MGKEVLEDLSRVLHRPRVLKVERVEEETPTIKTLYLKSDEMTSKAQPGQFLMVWVIGVDEIPIAISGVKDAEFGLTVARVGEATSRLHRLERGSPIGIRGPYGRGFDCSGKRLLMVGGGYGMAPLAFCAERAIEDGKRVTVLIGAKTARELLFLKRLEKAGAEVLASTDDGSTGRRGPVTELLRELLREQKFDQVLTCGPEPMMKKTLNITEKVGVPLQACLERMMKCAVGLCGSCCVGPYRVCADGPVFSDKELRKLEGEFGSFKRDECGKKVRF